MLFSRNWIADYVSLPAGPEATEDLARRLTAAGHAVELTKEVGDDVVLDVDVTTNRPDCMNHLGMAREAAVLYDRPLRPPTIELAEAAEPASDSVQIEIVDPDLCRRYVGRVVRGVTVGPSPEWLVRRLEAIGSRSINNVVDVTNYVLWEYGQPLHAFDLDRLTEQRIVVRRARAGEKLTTLDGQERKLEAGMLVIADAAVPVALAGVMGGLDSEVTETTRNVLIESACFDPMSVRTTARHLGMHTDASHRFERGTDPEICARAAERVAALLAELAGGEVLEGAVDVYPGPFETTSIRIHMVRLRAFAGAEIADSDARRWLEGLGCGVESRDEGWEVTIPSWRYRDLELPADVYEEVIRVHGFDGIEATLPAVGGADGHTPASHRRGQRIRDHLAACGYTEVINFAFHDAASDALVPGLYADGEALELDNPLSERYAVLRRSLLPNLVASARFNQRRGAPEVRLFELGHVFAGPGVRAAAAGAEPREMETVALVAGGRLGSPWDGQRDLDFFDLKGAVESLAAHLGKRLWARPATVPGLLPECSAHLVEVLNAEDPAAQIVVGFCGRWLEEEGFPLFVAEVATDVFAHRDEAASLAIEVPSRFPGIEADLTLTHARTVPWAQIQAAIREAAPADLTDFGLKDRYHGKGVPEGAVNTTISFLYSSAEHSLTQEVINERQAALAEILERRFGWEK